jgi:hypothetical protein
MTAQQDLTVRELRGNDAQAYRVLRLHVLAHHDEAFTSDAVSEAQRTAQSYAARLGENSDGSFTLGAFRGDALVGAITC